MSRFSIHNAPFPGNQSPFSTRNSPFATRRSPLPPLPPNYAASITLEGGDPSSDSTIVALANNTSDSGALETSCKSDAKLALQQGSDRRSGSPVVVEIAPGPRGFCYRHRYKFLRTTAWLLSIALAVGVHYITIWYVGPGPIAEFILENNRIYFVTYLAVVASVTSIFAFFLAWFVYGRYVEPRFRVLFAPFLTHLCLVAIVVPIVSMGRQIYSVYDQALGGKEYYRFTVSFIDSAALGLLLYAPMTRLCVMHNIFNRENYEVKYHWVLLRICVQYSVFQFFYFANLGPVGVHWIAAAALRAAIVCITLETVYYIVRLRNVPYVKESYVHILYICFYGLTVFVFIGVTLPLIDRKPSIIDEFNAVILTVWAMMLEILGPPTWYSFRVYMGWDTEEPVIQASVSCGDALRDALNDTALYPILLACAKKRYCDESVAFLHDGYPILAMLDTLEHEIRASKVPADGTTEVTTTVEYDLRHQFLRFLRNYVLKSATTPVNLSSAHLIRYRDLYTKWDEDDGQKTDLLKFKGVLEQSLGEITDLIATSGVLAMYDKSEERQAAIATRTAITRLQQG